MLLAGSPTMENKMFKSMDKATIEMRIPKQLRRRRAQLRVTGAGMLCALVCCAPALADPPVYSLIQVQLPPGFTSASGGGINNLGDIAFTAFRPGSTTVPPSNPPTRAVIWR